MSLTAAMLIGRSGLNAGQAGVQVASNNISNASTPGYSRQVMALQPARGQMLGAAGTIGRGVSIASIARQVSEAVQSRLWSSQASQAAAEAQLNTLSSLESALQELTGNDLSTELSAFFNTWSEAANLEQSDTLVVQQGQRLAEFFQRLRRDVVRVREQIQGQIDGLARRADELLDSVAELNRSIARTERGRAQANELRDRRDGLVSELAGLVDASVVEQADGQYDVLVAGTPVVLSARNLGLDVRRDADGSRLTSTVVLATNGQPLRVSGGTLGGLLAARDAGIEETLGTLDGLAANLAFEVNRIHATGVPSRGLRGVTASRPLPPADRALALNAPNNQSFAALPFGASGGGFSVVVRHSATGLTETVRIGVDLDGINDAGQPGFEDDTSAEDIRAAVDSVEHLSAEFGPDGRLRIQAASGYELAFADDTSGALALLGVNSFFEGSTAADINVRSDLLADPSRLGLARYEGDTLIDNGAALGIAAIQESAIGALGGDSLSGHWARRVQRVATDTEHARDRHDAAAVVRESLEAQRDAASGVSIDEESINLINYQKQYEGSARVISLAREMLDTLLRTI